MRRVLLGLLLLIVGVATLDAHDLFLKPFAFFVTPGTDARVRVLNGTFEKSENSITRTRLRALRVVGNRRHERPGLSNRRGGYVRRWRVHAPAYPAAGRKGVQ